MTGHAHFEQMALAQDDDVIALAITMTARSKAVGFGPLIRRPRTGGC